MRDVKQVVRMRRLRAKPGVRELIQETHLHITDLVMPLFVRHGENLRIPIQSMPGQYQLSVDGLSAEIADLVKLKIPAVILFGLPDHKDATGSAAVQEDGIIQRAIQEIKSCTQDLLVIADCCFCEYTDHGHCGVLMQDAEQQMRVDNDSTVLLLAEQAVSLAKAGADVIAPSAMMDGMVKAIRGALDKAGFYHVPILSYAVKYASSFYGPFREAADGAPKFGDRAGYQMDPANGMRALREAQLDIEEGADMLMIKPALSYLDVVVRIKQAYPFMPLAAYQVSGEYAMIKAAAANGWLDEEKVILESLLSIKRAGADFIISYFAKEAAKLLSVA